MAKIQSEPLQQAETTCGSLLCELQVIWDEVGEPEVARDKMLLELEQECLELYRRKVDNANRYRAQIRQAIADSEAELAAICSAMGELPVHIRQGQQAGSLKEELNTIIPQLEEMRKRKRDRKNQFLEVVEQIQKLSTEINGSEGFDCSKVVVNDNELSLRKLEELQTQLQSLQEEKRNRLKRVMELLRNMSSLCSVLGLDFKEKVKQVHPSLAGSEESHCISTETFQQLESAILGLHRLKLQRMQRLQDLATMLLELWNLMDTPIEEQQPFQNVTCNIAASEDEITGPNMVSADFIKHVEAEVSRLEELKSSKMKELVLGKKAELVEICRRTHLVSEADKETDNLVESLESGALDPASVLEQIELDIGKVKEEAFSRQDILERVEKWLSAREEEEWLEQYNMDENRYNAGRGTHLTLKRAEKARTLVNKLPGMTEALAAKVQAWENERTAIFLYDGIHLLSMLEEYTMFRQEKEQERKRQREQKKLQGQLISEQEALFGSKPSPLKHLKKSSKLSAGGKGSSVGSNMPQTPRPSSSQSARATTPSSRPFKRDENAGLTTARKALDVSNLLVKNNSFNGRESDHAVSRRPFSPITVTASSRPNPDFIDEQNIPQEYLSTQQQAFSKNGKTSTSETSLTTSSKTIPANPAADGENCIPQASQMVTSMTPAQQSHLDSNSQDDESDEEEEIEYSVEELRAGFVPPNTHIKRALQV